MYFRGLIVRMRYPEFKQLHMPSIEQEILKYWKEASIFEKSIQSRNDAPGFVFYEGPPSANGMPGIHHVLSRTIKDIFCRYKTLAGYKVERRAGWDTHGLPVELGVEKELGIRKEDIGVSISIEEYNKKCKEAVMRYTGAWNSLTEKMGYWVDMDHPYVTYENNYIESVWWLLKQIYSKGYLYKGYTIQPFSPAAGTGLSTHELNQPGTYKPLTDTTVVALFKAVGWDAVKALEAAKGNDLYFLAWTTTPWTLPSNTALAVGKDITYALIKTKNPYSSETIYAVLAKDRLSAYFDAAFQGNEAFDAYKPGDKKVPYVLLNECKGSDVEGLRYEQLMPYMQPTDGDAFRVITGDFVTTEDGTGIVHIAPSFGSDDFRAARQQGIGSLTLVNRQGRFLAEVTDFAHEYVKEQYLTEEEKQAELEIQKEVWKDTIKNLTKYLSVDERIALKLKMENKAFRIEKYEHSYPHCWRTDKPILYYPLDSWFIKTTAVKDRMIELNKTINWKPESTGTGRFGNWLENLQDWNLSRSRYWGIPLPVWRTEDALEEKCIGSIEELKQEIEKASKAGIDNSAYALEDGALDLHRPYIDKVILVSDSGKRMYRELDLIDVWFDSGSMPYAQSHYMGKGTPVNFPADFIAEGVDQTRGWFFTLHAIAALVFDSVAYKNVVSNGLVLDKTGQKMSKRLGNTVEPFEAIETYSADALRWYMIGNAAPWDNLKFDMEGVKEVQRKFFGTLYNTYSFFALYANVDGWQYHAAKPAPESYNELDRWILSRLQSLIKEVNTCYESYEPHRAVRLLENFVDRNLSNWYIRLSRRRFWKGELSADKEAAYHTLYTCLTVTCQLACPVAPFFTDWMFRNLSPDNETSVHLSDLPVAQEAWINTNLQDKMQIAQDICSMVLGIRKKENIKVRIPLQKLQIPVLNESMRENLLSVEDLLKSELNIKEVELVNEGDVKLVKNLKLNFKSLGKKYGKLMKAIQQYALENGEAVIEDIEMLEKHLFTLEGEAVELLPEDVEIIPVDIPGWKVANEGSITVALDVTITPELQQEGVARELINRIQNMRKESDLELTDKINVEIEAGTPLLPVVNQFSSYICAEILANRIAFSELVDEGQSIEIEDIKAKIRISKA